MIYFLLGFIPAVLGALLFSGGLSSAWGVNDVNRRSSMLETALELEKQRLTTLRTSQQLIADNVALTNKMVQSSDIIVVPYREGGFNTQASSPAWSKAILQDMNIVKPDRLTHGQLVDRYAQTGDPGDLQAVVDDFTEADVIMEENQARKPV